MKRAHDAGWAGLTMVANRLDALRFGTALALHVVVAALVTAHVLLRKREVGAALGWIGLTWLAPIAGGVLYLGLGINRVRRRARRLDRRPRVRGTSHEAEGHGAHGGLDLLQKGIGRISHRRLEGGNAIQTYQNGDEAYPAMLAAIEAATTSIGLSSFIMHLDGAGTRFVEALAAAQRRGVAVRVIVDGIGGGYILSRAYHALRRRGVPVGRFMHSPLPWRMPLLNLRSHKKILVVDGHVGFTGGMNIADENVMGTHPRTPVQDTHFKVTGPVVAQLVDAFADDWAFVTGEDLDGPAWFPPLSPAGHAEGHASGHAKARVITSGPDQDIEKIEFGVMQAIACARSSIYVMTPYFVSDERLNTALALAAMRGVAVHVVMPRRSNHVFVDWASRANIGSLLKDGVNIWLGPEPFRHSKVMVVDGEWSLIGSANWDMRSFRLNFEVCVEVYDRALAQALQHFVTSHRGAALTNRELGARPLPVRLRDAGVRLMMPYL